MRHASRSHVLAVVRAALNHHRGELNHGVGDLGIENLPMAILLGGDDRCKGQKHDANE